MSFVQNGSFETLSQATANTQNTSTDSNPFGLKDFSRMLDKKFGFSAFSDNLLASPQGGSTNPFERGNTKETDYNDYYNKNNPYTAGKRKAGGVSATKKGDSGHSEEFSSVPLSIFEGGFNKGTGMASGGRSRHKLDFCY